MTRIFADVKKHDPEFDGLDGPHAHTTEIDEETLTLFHTVIHDDGTVAHEMVWTVTPAQFEQYLVIAEHWKAKGFYEIEYTNAQHEARTAIHAKHIPKQLTGPKQLPALKD